MKPYLERDAASEREASRLVPREARPWTASWKKVRRGKEGGSGVEEAECGRWCISWSSIQPPGLMCLLKKPQVSILFGLKR